MNVIQILKEYEPQIKEKYPVKSLGLFGSFSRGNYDIDSDVDILVEFKTPVDIFEFIDLKDFLSELLKKEVDLVSVKALKPRLKKQILQEVIYV